MTEAILNVLFLPFTWVFSAIPTVSWPAWFAVSGSGTVGGVADEWGDHVGMLGSLFPVTAFFDALGIVALVGAASLAIRVVRVLVSMLTGGGGAV